MGLLKITAKRGTKTDVPDLKTFKKFHGEYKLIPG